MKVRGKLAFLACAAIAVLALPASAVAKPGYNVRPAGTELFLDLGEKGEYEVLVEANNRQRVVLSVEDGLFSATEFSTEGRVNSNRIEADFGALGQIDIDVHLNPRRSWRYQPKKGCKGPASLEVPGTFRGTIEFSGEGDIPPFSVKRGEISFTRRFKRVCKQRLPESGKGGKKRPKLDVSLLEVFGKAEGRTSFFGALNFAPRRKPARSFGFGVAGAYQRSEGVLIESSTLTLNQL